MPGKAILCVDDEKIILDSLKSQLKKHFADDYIYETAMNADEAIEIIDELNDNKVSIVIIVSDWLMPGIKGDEFLIRVHKQFPGIVKILMTGHADMASIQNARDHANLYKYFAKPWDESELIEAIIAVREKNGNE